jgi:hypothetical protein
MSKFKKKETTQAILDAIRAKHAVRTACSATEIAELEASLLADIETFDIDAAEKLAKLDHVKNIGACQANTWHAFPKIVPAGVEKALSVKKQEKPPESASKSPLLEQLRERAAEKQHELRNIMAKRNAANEEIAHTLKQVFFFLHELVQQLNIIKPEVPRSYPLVDHIELNDMVWLDGFADYRTQAHSVGALLEMVTFSYQLHAPTRFTIGRDIPGIDRLRSQLFDYGLQFSCKEFHNERRHVERAEFHIQSQISVSVRWRADFAENRIVLETRNLERLGSMLYYIQPQRINQSLLDEFGRLVLGQANRFKCLLHE